VTICLVNNAAIARWNNTYRGKKGATDVLSFPANDVPSMPKKQAGRRKSFSNNLAPYSPSRAPSPPGDGYLGDIAIAPAVARRNSRRFGRTLSEEMCILVLHGILHLMGYDHETDNGEMDRRERRLRRQFGLA